MKKLARSMSGNLRYSPKWQNNCEGRSYEIESGDGRHSDEMAQVFDTEAGNVMLMRTPGAAAAPQISSQPRGQQGNRTESRLDRQSAMYKAILAYDWPTAEQLLARDPTLARDEITERGDRALHVAVSMERNVFVQKLVEKMSLSDLELLDESRGYTACCYAAITGTVKNADVMMKRNPNLIIKRDKNGKTPLHKAALHGNEEMVSYFLKFAKVEDLRKEEWFDLLLVAILRRMYDEALEILKKDGSLATMRNDEGTALHLLARQDISSDSFTSKKRRAWLKGSADFLGLRVPRNKGYRDKQSKLAEKLLAEIQRLEQSIDVLELLRKPPVLHDAAKVGNAELITMLTFIYPDLIWDTDGNGHTMFHIAVIYRQDKVFNLIYQIGAARDLITMSQDAKDHNNILHLAAKQPPPSRRTSEVQSAIIMQCELIWFKIVEIAASPSCLEMKNVDEHTPRELFSKEHEKLLNDSKQWLWNTADSCMLIATIMVTVVFAAAFTAPGGYNQTSGIPILLKGNNWFTSFVIFEAIALFGSTFSITVLWFLMTSSFDEEKFLMSLISQLFWGLAGLLLSFIGAISAFLSAYFLVFIQESPSIVKFFIILVYVWLVGVIFFFSYGLLRNLTRPLRLFRRLSPPSWYTLFIQKRGINHNPARGT